MGRACLDDNEVTELLEGRLRQARRAEIELHLDACDACRSLVSELAQLGEGQRDDTQREPVPDPEPQVETTSDGSEDSASHAVPGSTIGPGDRVDHFEVIGRLGQGGMGEVYAAWDRKLDRKVALKMVRPRLLGSAEAIARFSREARATARFSHPNIVTIHEVGQWQGRPYVALEFLEGQTLAERARVDPPEPDEVIRIGRAVVEALVEAHRHGVLHRDLKLDNVHIDPLGRVRVLDFGLAKLVSTPEPAPVPVDDRDADVDPFQTEARVATGTPMAMAPEQWTGQPSTEATDVWAVGVLLFTLLSGERPTTGTTMQELKREVLSPEPLRRLDALVSSLPPALVDCVAACLDKDAGARPTTAELLETLRDPMPPSIPVAPGRSRAWLVAGVLVLAVGGFGLALGRGGSSDVGEATEAAVTPAVTPTAEPPRTDLAASSPGVVPAATPSEVVPTTPPPVATPTPEESPDAPVVTAPEPTPTPRPRPRRTRRRSPKPDKDALFGTRE